MIVRSTAIRRTTICVATTLAICLSNAATAGVLDRAKSRAQNTAAKAGTVVRIVRERRPVATAVRNVGRNLRNTAQNLPGAKIFEMVRKLKPIEQLQDNIELMRELNAGYVDFSGGLTGCQASCKVFRAELADVFDDFASIVQQVPTLRRRPGLVDQLDRLPNLINHVPARALYFMSQAMGNDIDNLREETENIRQMLQILPPFESNTGIASLANTRSTADPDRPICSWVNRDERPVIALIEAKLERIGWVLRSTADLIPDIEVKAEVGAEAGVAVANGTAAAGAALDPTDVLKIALNALAMVPEGIKMAININILRAKVVCLATE